MAEPTTPTPQAPAAAKPAEPAAPATPPAAAAKTPETPKAPPWGSDENFKPAEAWELIQNLRKEKAPDTSALETKVAEMQASTEARNKALAEALGLTEPPKSEDALAETVKSLQEKFEASQRETTRLRIAAEKGVPAEYHHLLTETDTEKLTAQAEMAAEYARLKAAAAGTPEFQTNPGQGQGGAPGSPEALAEAEYAKFYPPPK
ncbi:hypothetical protein [Aeromicrobium sp. 9AM]|uniref:hypothetical protein n=1 Tax=Aeromicrobium sp. 9AM TaxID=2653126 RepID=UPI0012F3B5FC|nr:hypothetical protein [Aeromicrobium sp. 9AM]VXC08408.1 conserved hypothetical protein [Aeromicrobium sp. 9AM]